MAPGRFMLAAAAHLVVATHALVSYAPRAPPLVARRAYADSIFPSTASDVFVGNLPYGMDDDYVEALVHSMRGDDGVVLKTEVLKVTVPRDAETGKDRGIAFVKVLDAAQARDVAEALDGFEFEGRVLNSNVKERKKWVDRRPAPEKLDDGGLLEALATLPDKFAIQEYGLEKARNACKIAGIKGGGDLEQVTARLLKIQGVAPEIYLDPAFGLLPTRGGKRNAYWG